LNPEQIEVDIWRADELEGHRGLRSERDARWSFVARKTNPRWLWHAIDHHTGKVLAYVFGRRQDTVFVKLKALLEPLGITRYYTDGWGAYERHLDAEKHTEGKHPENREQTHQLAHAAQAIGTPHHLFLQDETDARAGHRALHQSARVWASSLTWKQQI
jgi:insertion element IS1 protein InsB